MSKKKTINRERVYSYVAERLRAADPPTLREVQAAMGFKAVETARTYLDGLVQDGRLIKRGTASRSYGLPPSVWTSSKSHRIPLLGTVQAGGLTLAQQEPEGYLEVERSRYGEELFALRVRGQSINGAGIQPDDLVIVRRQPTAGEGDIVVAMVEDEATVKRLRFSGTQIVLWPENPDFKPLLLSPKELTLLGKVVEVRRYYEAIPLLDQPE